MSAEAAERGSWQEQLDVSVYADSSFTIPGRGDPGPGCGEWAPREFCDTCATVEAGPHQCVRRECPECHTIWTGRRAEAATVRLMSGRWAEDDGIGRRLVHGCVSPPEGSVRTLNDVRQMRSKAHDLAKEHGIRGAVSVFHAYRVKEEVKTEYRRLLDENQSFTEGGLWKWVTENGRAWDFQVYWSPHVHYVGLSRDFTELNPENDDGWVVARLSTLPAFESLHKNEPYEAVIGCIRYLLSHASFEGDKGTKAITWMGSLHPSNFQAKEEISPGALRVIERKASELTGGLSEESEGDGASDPEDCDCDDCGGSMRSIYDAGRYLSDPEWCHSVETSKERRLSVMYDWALGEVAPPPGMKHPSSEDEYNEVADELVSRRPAYG